LQAGWVQRVLGRRREGWREDTGLFTLSDQSVIQPKDNFVVFGNQDCKLADWNQFSETSIVN